MIQNTTRAKLKSCKIKHRQLTIKRQALNKQNQRRLSGAEHNMQNTALQSTGKTIDAELCVGHEE
jgi:hypothetical protein